MHETISASLTSIERTIINIEEAVETTLCFQLLEEARDAVERRLPVVIDCHAAAYIPYAVVQILIVLERACRDRGIPFAYTGMQESVVSHLQRSGLLDHISSPMTIAE